MIFCKTKFFVSCIDAWNRLSESKKIVLLSQSLMRWDSRQVWWDDVFVKLEMTLSSSLMKWRLFRQVWWVAFVKFDESLHFKFDEMFCQAWRLIIDVARQIENRHTSLDNREWACIIRQKVKLNNQKKTDDDMIKHDHENESFQTKSAKDKSESYFSDHISHFETKRKTRY
jgi:hypothetical protein